MSLHSGRSSSKSWRWQKSFLCSRHVLIGVLKNKVPQASKHQGQNLDPIPLPGMCPCHKMYNDVSESGAGKRLLCFIHVILRHSPSLISRRPRPIHVVSRRPWRPCSHVHVHVHVARTATSTYIASKTDPSAFTDRSGHDRSAHPSETGYGAEDRKVSAETFRSSAETFRSSAETAWSSAETPYSPQLRLLTVLS